MARILSISSQVARGHVGNSAAVFALMSMGHDVVAVPTVVLAHHPGHARAVARQDIADIAALGRDALLSPAPHPVDAVLTGYFASPAQVAAAAGLISLARGLRPGIPVVVDPVCGDAGRLYGAPGVAQAIAERLLPLADVATPNVTELAALAAPDEIADAPNWTRDRAIAAARSLPAPRVVVTSAPGAAPGYVATLTVTADGADAVATPRVETAVHGAGDLLAALVTGHMSDGREMADAVRRAAASVHAALGETLRLGDDELALATTLYNLK